MLSEICTLIRISNGGFKKIHNILNRSYPTIIINVKVCDDRCLFHFHIKSTKTDLHKTLQ